MNNKRVTVYDIAKKVGVSHTTVALALHSSGRISEKRRKVVQQVAEEMGYRPDPQMAALAAYRMRNQPATFHGALAWINRWDQPERLRKHGEYDAYWRGASHAADHFGYRLEEILWPRDCSAKCLERILVTRGIKGAFIPPHPEASDWSEFDWSKLSVIRFGMSVYHPNTHLVTSDHSRAVLMAVTRMREYGYKRIGLVLAEDYDRRLGGNYYGGYCCAQHYLKLDPVLPPLLLNQATLRETPAKVKQALQRWLRKHKPDAILTTEAQVPVLLRDIGRKIPEDVAVAGTSTYDVPVDAGICQNSEEIGRVAAEILVKQINISERGEPSDPCRILIESRWRDGSSLPPRKRV